MPNYRLAVGAFDNFSPVDLAVTRNDQTKGAKLTYDGAANLASLSAFGASANLTISAAGILSIASPELTGLARAPTPSASTVDTTIATAAYAGGPWSTFTPKLACRDGSLTTSLANGRYKQVGKLYHWSLDLLIINAGSCTGQVSFTLPNSSSAKANSGAGVGGETAANAKQVYVLVNANSHVAYMFMYDGSTIAVTGNAYSLAGMYEAN